MKPNFAIIHEKIRGGFTWVLIDQKKATLKGFKLKETGNTGRRKFENLLIITRPRERLKIFYQT